MKLYMLTGEIKNDERMRSSSKVAHISTFQILIRSLKNKILLR